jgi:hypothetical protein
MKTQMFAAFLIAGVATPVLAQTSADGLRRVQSVEKRAAEEAMPIQLHDKIVRATKERMPVEVRTTAGAPYSAEAVTESTQTLADGNRINRKVTTRVYRDGQGRIRREQLNEAGVVESTSIVDSVGGTTYVYEDRVTQTVEGVALAPGQEGAGGIAVFKGNVHVRDGGNVFYETRRDFSTKEDAAASGAPVTFRRAEPAQRVADGATVREDLGVSTIEGLPATGTRTTTTIPAGAIGNLQPIKVVSEEWFSPDLQVLVLTKHTDPRAGETVYRLLNIVRAEPDPSLFNTPPDPAEGKAGVRVLQTR